MSAKSIWPNHRGPVSYGFDCHHHYMRIKALWSGTEKLTERLRALAAGPETPGKSIKPMSGSSELGVSPAPGSLFRLPRASTHRHTHIHININES